MSAGIIAIGLLLIVFSMAELCLIIMAPYVAQGFANISGAGPELQAQADMIAASVSSRFSFSAALCVAGLIAGAGLLARRNWARLLTVAVAGVSGIVAAVNIVSQAGALIEQQGLAVLLLSLLLVVGWNGFMIGYLLRPPVAAQFHKPAVSR